MTEPLVDIITVYHNKVNRDLSLRMAHDLAANEPFIPYAFTPVDNIVENRGFARGCNFGARRGIAPIIGFLNPDVAIDGPLLGTVLNVLADPRTVITGERFGKAPAEIRTWGCADWVCGAAFFVKRAWFDAALGFDERFVWGWEETDLIRQAQAGNLNVRSVLLPIRHASPAVNSPQDVDYKNRWFEEGARRFKAKWNR